MRTKTNKKGLIDLAVTFLYLPIEKTPFYPAIVNHPFFQSAIVSIADPETKELILVNMDEDDEEKKQLVYSAYKRMIADSFEEEADRILIHIRPGYKMAFLKYAKPMLSNSDFSTMLKDVWIESENPNQDPNVSVKVASGWFKKADKDAIMDKSEKEYLDKLPKSFRVYRGVSVGRNPNGLSWTDNLDDTASWFAHRFDSGDKKGYIRTGIVNKEDVYAYFNSRGENELAIDPKNIKELTVL